MNNWDQVWLNAYWYMKFNPTNPSTYFLPQPVVGGHDSYGRCCGYYGKDAAGDPGIWNGDDASLPGTPIYV